MCTQVSYKCIHQLLIHRKSDGALVIGIHKVEETKNRCQTWIFINRDFHALTFARSRLRRGGVIEGEAQGFLYLSPGEC